MRELLKDIEDEPHDKVPGIMWYGVMSTGAYKLTMPVCLGIPRAIVVLKCIACVGIAVVLFHAVHLRSFTYLPLALGYLAQITCPLRLKQPLLELGMLGSLLLLTFS